ncbi:MAG TPA: transposase [Pseudonocardiaceae bacterium]|nr:transposase [Pseudonocardiaceae bacterium]
MADRNGETCGGSGTVDVDSETKHQFLRLIPAGLWELAEPLVPPPGVRAQGGGRAPIDPYTVFTTLVFMLVTGCPWRSVPVELGVSPPTLHRKFALWDDAGLFTALQAKANESAGDDPQLLAWASAISAGAKQRQVRHRATKHDCPHRKGRDKVTDEQHQHEGFEIPDDFRDPAGRPVDHDLLGRFVGAGFDGCTSCQDALLTLMVEDAATTARLVELACVITHKKLGGLPACMTEPDVPGMASPEFRALARAGTDDRNHEMFAACERMSVAERRAAANTAADMVIGQLLFAAGE